MYTKSVVTTEEAIAKCEDAADAADSAGRRDLAEGFRSAANNLRGLKPFLDE